jgi:hypothetical protein
MPPQLAVAHETVVILVSGLDIITDSLYITFIDITSRFLAISDMLTILI